MNKAKKATRRTVARPVAELDELRAISAQLDRIETRIDGIQEASVKSGAVAGAVAGAASGGLVYGAIEIIKMMIGVG